MLYKISKFLICLIGWTTLHNSLNAHEVIQPNAEHPAPLTITELLDMALRNNHETQSAWWKACRAAASACITKSAYYPTLGARGTLVHGRDYKFINGQTTNYTTGSGDVFLDYLLYDFGERQAARDAAKAALKAANWQSDWTLQKVMYTVIHNTYAFLNAQEQLNSRQTSLQDALISLDAAKELQRAGLRSISDIYALQATISEMQIGIALQKAEADIAKGKLAASIGIGVDVPLDVADLPDPQVDNVMQAGLRKLIAAANQKRSDLMAKRAEVQQKEALRDKISKGCRPKIGFKTDGGYRRYFDDKANGCNYNIGLYIDIPLFNGFEATYQNRIAYSDVQISEIELANLELEIALEVLTYSSWFSASQEILQLAHENLLNSFKSFEGVLEKYKAGTQTIFDLTAAQKQLADARLKHADAKTRWYRSLAQLAYATGTIMPNTEIPCITTE